jgi:indolepyruvate ferredoxin oxidoreductase beta subunit
MAAIKNNLHIKQAEVHGMSQRGGSVQSNLRISDTYIASDIIPQGSADIILSVEPMESLRYLPYLSRNGWLVTNTTPFLNIPDYPDIKKLMNEIKALSQHILIDADKIASELGSQKSSNMVILGAASPYLGIPFKSIKESINQKFSRKGPEIVNVNIRALETGRTFARLNTTVLP